MPRFFSRYGARRTGFKRYGFKRRSSYRKRSYSSRPKRTFRPMRAPSYGMKHQMIHVKLMGTINFLPSAAPYTANASYGFKSHLLNECIGYSNYTAMWRQYRINKIVIQFYACGTPTEQGNSWFNGDATHVPTAAYGGEIVTVVAHTRLVTPSAVTDLFRFPNFKIHRGGSTFSLTYTPSCLDTIDGGDAPKYKQWIRTSDDDIPHYGMMYVIYNPEVAVNTTPPLPVLPRWRTREILYVSFKDPSPAVVSKEPESVPADEEYMTEEADWKDCNTLDECKQITTNKLKNLSVKP